MAVVAKATIINDIFHEFYDLIHFYVADPNRRSKWFFNSYPDFILDSASIRDSDYPLMVIGRPSTPHKILTFQKSMVNFVITVEIMATNGSQCTTLADSVVNAVLSRRPSLADSGLQLVDLQNSDDDMVMRGESKVHIITLTFKGRFAFLKVPGS